VYAKQNLPLPRRRGLAIFCQVLGFYIFFGFVAQTARADSFEEAGRALARKVWTSARGGTVSCEFRNLATLRRGEFASFSAAFQQELQQRGAKIVAADAAAKLVVSVTQDPAEYLAVVQIQRGENSETVMETIGPVDGPAAPEPAFSLTLHREFLFSQDGPILDVVLDDGKHAETLGTEAIRFYELQADQWVLTGSEHLPTHQPAERDERGFIFQGIDSKAAYLSGEVCTLSLLPGTKGWECERNTDQIPVRAVATEAMAGKKIGAWISAAPLEMDGKTRFMVTGEDGLARLYEDGAEPVAVFPNWGSEIASVYSGCGSGWQLLVTGNGDWTKPDEIQAMDIQERRAQAVSDPMGFPGPVIALRTPGTRTATNAAANGEAVAVDRNLQTGRYEAYLLSISCSK
ncbi:MAG: hypothetical protein WBW58_17860, partial [Candidatus Acidiferrum sp.]